MEGTGNFTWAGGLPGKGNLRNSDFGDLNLCMAGMILFDTI